MPAEPARRTPAARAPAGSAPKRVPAVTRAVAILRLLGRSPTPLGVHAIATPLKLVPSTCLHILRALAAEELVAFDAATKKYTLSAGILAIARGLLRTDTFGDLVRADLDRLARRFGVTAIGVEATGLDHMVVVALSRPAQPLRLHVDVGSRFPALISATGRCLAAFGDHDWSAIERRFRALRWARPPSWTAWRRQVAATRGLGYAVDDGDYIEGVTIVAAPVFATDGPVHFVVAVGLGEQLRRIGLETLGQALCEIAAPLGARLRDR